MNIQVTSAHVNSFSWQGYKLNQRLQALAWPRVGVIDADGYDAIPVDNVPIEVLQATAGIGNS